MISLAKAESDLQNIMNKESTVSLSDLPVDQLCHLLESLMSQPITCLRMIYLSETRVEI